MATFRKRGKRWQAIIKDKGKTTARSFATKGEALGWVASVNKQTGKHTLRDALIRYRDEISVKKRGAVNETKRLNAYLKKLPLLDAKLDTITRADMADWRDQRGREVKPNSVRRDMTILSHMFRIAVEEWQWINVNPMTGLRRPKQDTPRDFVYSDADIQRICDVLGYAPGTVETSMQEVAVIFLFALETAMRQGEICSLSRADVSGRVTHLSMTKNGDARDVPLSSRAIELLGQCRGDYFTLTATNVSSVFRRATRIAGVGGTFHDSRRTATVRLSRKVDVLTLAKITGHRDLKILLNTYYKTDMQGVADTLD